MGQIFTYMNSSTTFHAYSLITFLYNCHFASEDFNSKYHQYQHKRLANLASYQN
jgi:hypothetical protein